MFGFPKVVEWATFTVGCARYHRPGSTIRIQASEYSFRATQTLADYRKFLVQTVQRRNRRIRVVRFRTQPDTIRRDGRRSTNGFGSSRAAAAVKEESSGSRQGDDKGG